MKNYISKITVALLGLVLVGCSQSSGQALYTTCNVSQPSFGETVTILAKSDSVQSETISLVGSAQRIQSAYEDIVDFEDSRGISIELSQTGVDVDALLSVMIDYAQVDIQSLSTAALFTGAQTANSKGEISLSDYTSALEQKGYVCSTPK